jgi:hypothetical protein
MQRSTWSARHCRTVGHFGLDQYCRKASQNPFSTASIQLGHPSPSGDPPIAVGDLMRSVFSDSDLLLQSILNYVLGEPQSYDGEMS